MTRHILRTAATVVTVILITSITLTVNTGPAPAAQAGTHETASHTKRPISVTRTQATAQRPGNVSALSACPITRHGYSGYYICGFRTDYWTWGGDGNIEYFVIGLDYAVWHTWPGAGGWHSLGGVAGQYDVNGVWALPTTRYIRVIGTDNQWWCRYWSGGTWPGWTPSCPP
jgi:hypothetical protein